MTRYRTILISNITNILAKWSLAHVGRKRKPTPIIGVTLPEEEEFRALDDTAPVNESQMSFLWMVTEVFLNVSNVSLQRILRDHESISTFIDFILLLFSHEKVGRRPG